MHKVRTATHVIPSFTITCILYMTLPGRHVLYHLQVEVSGELRDAFPAELSNQHKPSHRSNTCFKSLSVSDPLIAIFPYLVLHPYRSWISVTHRKLYKATNPCLSQKRETLLSLLNKPLCFLITAPVSIHEFMFQIE